MGSGRAACMSLSITALPTWLADGGFAPLVGDLDHFVLQVHSLEKPETIDRPVTLCDPQKTVAWAEMANEAGTPFHVALPTYGYRLVFDTDDRFVALSAEGPRPVTPPGYRVGVVMANPLAMAPLAAHLRRHRPPGDTVHRHDHRRRGTRDLSAARRAGRRG